ncbi:cytochrome P450 2A5-like [Styela clava]
MVLTITVALVGVLIGLLVYLSYRSMVRPANFPPGPLGIPILGSLHLLKEFPERDMLKLAKKYGNIFSLKTAAKNFVCVCGTEFNKKVLNHKDIANRPTTYAFSIIKGNELKGIVHSSCSKNRTLNRALVHSAFTDANGFGIEELVGEEITSLMDHLEDMFEHSVPKDICDILMTSSSNSALSVIFGIEPIKTIKEKHQNDEILRCVIFLRKVYEDKMFLLPELIPGLQNLWLPKSAKKFISTSEYILKYCTDQLENHKSGWDPEKPRDMVDLYLNKMDEEKELRDPVFTKVNFQHLLLDILIGGLENTGRTLTFAVLYLAAHQDIQEKIHKEIATVLGSDRKLRYEDRLKMHYTKATVFEISRFSSLAPLGLPRRAIKDVNVCGYSIPKGTTFLMNSYSSNMQDNKWKNPKNFDPENFLDENGKFIMNDAFMAFGDGQRKCVGIPLIERQLFMYLVKLIQKFHVKPETDDTKIDYEPLGGLIHTAKPQKLRLQLREDYD